MSWVKASGRDNGEDLVTFGFWATYTHVSLTTEVILCAFSDPLPLLKKDWGALSKLPGVHIMMHMAIVIGVMRYSTWIQELILRCIFIGVASVICVWLVTVLPITLWEALIEESTDTAVEAESEEEGEEDKYGESRSSDDKEGPWEMETVKPEYEGLMDDNLRSLRVPALDMVRAFLMFLLILNTSIAATLSRTSLVGSYQLSPTTTAVLSGFTAFYRTLFAPSLYFISGTSSYISLSLHHKGHVAEFLFSKMCRFLIVVFVWALWALGAHWVYGAPLPLVDVSDFGPPHPLYVYYLENVMGYVVTHLFLDVCFTLWRVADGAFKLNRAPRFTSHIDYPRAWIALALLSHLLYTISVLSGRSLLPFFTRYEFHLQYVIAYLGGVNISSLAKLRYTSASSQCGTPRFILSRAIIRVWIMSSMLLLLCTYASSVQLSRYLHPMSNPEAPLLDPLSSSSLTGDMVVVVMYGAWSTLTFALLGSSLLSFLLSDIRWSMLEKQSMIAVFIRNAGWLGVIQVFITLGFSHFHFLQEVISSSPFYFILSSSILVSSLFAALSSLVLGSILIVAVVSVSQYVSQLDS
ncbi:hypothetical protein D9613_000133 [Agrocybe pediades]|uniref:Uncharacterized protein n=1 Tax=Agrocybe pediades TaxID=84607 RepID=A0A8H4R1Z2_9AGAR|nr:hypothetical protein D9613_000133 [Agrocybe pediades]